MKGRQRKGRFRKGEGEDHWKGLAAGAGRGGPGRGLGGVGPAGASSFPGATGEEATLELALGQRRTPCTRRCAGQRRSEVSCSRGTSRGLPAPLRGPGGARGFCLTTHPRGPRTRITQGLKPSSPPSCPDLHTPASLEATEVKAPPLGTRGITLQRPESRRQVLVRTRESGRQRGHTGTRPCGCAPCAWCPSFPPEATSTSGDCVAAGGNAGRGPALRGPVLHQAALGGPALRQALGTPSRTTCEGARALPG